MKLYRHEETALAVAVERLEASGLFAEARSAFLEDPGYCIAVAEGYRLARSRATKKAAKAAERA